MVASPIGLGSGILLSQDKAHTGLEESWKTAGNHQLLGGGSIPQLGGE